MSHGKRFGAGSALLLGALVLGAQAGGLLEGKGAGLLKKAKPAPSQGADEDCAADSLARLWTQDVDIDKHKSAVHKLAWRAELVDLNLKSARASVDNARSEIFAVAATAEQRKQLEELDGRITEASGQAKDELIAEKQRYQQEAIEQSRTDGSLEQKRLSGEQTGRMAMVAYNLGMAAWCNGVAFRSLDRLGRDFNAAKADPVGMLDLKVTRRLPEIAGNLVQWPGQISQQLGAIGQLTGAIGVLRRNNAIEERPPDPGQGWATEENF